MKIEGILNSVSKIGTEGAPTKNFSDFLNSPADMAQVIDAQREVYKLHYQVEFASRIGESASSLVKRLQQGG